MLAHTTLLYTYLLEPFFAHAFMLKALLGCAALALGCGSVGGFLVLRRMSLIADALSHGLFPGVALAFLCFGFQVLPLSIAGAFTGVVLALIAHWITQKTMLPKDSTFAALVLFSMASGLFILSAFGSYTDVMHILVGNILVLSKSHLFWLMGVGSFTLIALALFYRPLVLQAFDPQFFRMTYPRGGWLDQGFLIIVTLNMVCAFQALGSLMALGLLLLPAITARLWAKQIWTLCALSTIFAFLASLAGLLISYHTGFPAGPLIILVSVAFYALSLLLYVTGLKLRYVGCVALLLAALPFVFHAPASAPKPPHIVVSFTILKDLVYQICGHQLRIKSLAGPNQDPHTFEPSPQDILELTQARLVIINGLNLENHWMERFLKERPPSSLVVASQRCPPLFFDDTSQKIPDPHAWHNINNVRSYVAVIVEALCKTWPHMAPIFRFRARLFDQKLKDLNRWVRTRISALPPEKRCALTTHDAFGYFAKAYGFSFLSPLGISTDDEPSAKKIALLIEEIKRRDIRGIFFENMVSPKIMNALSQETGVTIGGTLYSDALSPPDGPAADYIALVKHNVNTLLAPLEKTQAQQGSS